MKAVHSLDGGLCGGGVVVGHEAEALREVGLFVDEHLGGDDVPKWQERGRQVRVRELLRQVVDEQVSAFWA